MILSLYLIADLYNFDYDNPNIISYVLVFITLNVIFLAYIST
jgi:hypothetical protein